MRFLLPLLGLIALTTGCQGDPPVCGNELLEAAEVCDDGNNVSGDGCNAICTSEEYCGNGILDPQSGEQCEDGNVVDDDGCSAECHLEAPPACGDGTEDPGEQCDDGNLEAGDGCSPYCRDEECGNGILDPGEQCEDGNTFDDDGCDHLCQFEEPGYCGDGDRDDGEQCDDGNNDPGDGCSPICNYEICGNGFLDPDEACEDGNTDNGDGCSEECEFEGEGFCGDTVKDPGEECEDGNTDPGDGCSPICTFEECGNGYLDPGEECEDGNEDDEDGCSGDCEIEALVTCGNGVEDDGEQCDDGNFITGDGCSPYCTDEECGNGILDPGEACEDGNTDSGDGCSSTCQREVAGRCGDGTESGTEECDDGNTAAGDGCSPWCTDEECGNGILDPGEVCEDANLVSGDGCSADCLSAEVCGNDIEDVHEACDDGNLVSGDGCDSRCRIEGETCGDGVLDLLEGCDDGNTLDGDGCSSTCLIETCGDGHLDADERCDDGDLIDTDDCPSTCRPAACGDGFVHATDEECDDGNRNNGDGCSAYCEEEECGNGRIDPGEDCDDMNDVDTDSCVDCEAARCGDGHEHEGVEMCDDGNTEGGDGCSADCRSDETCTNGIIDPGEECDDGDEDDGDACPTTCKNAFCSDGFVWRGHEGCDDGDLIDGDGCSSTCVPDGCGSGGLDGDEECDEGGANGTHGASCFDDCVSIDIEFEEAGTWNLDSDGDRGLEPEVIRAGDFNDDGVLDLVTANYGSGDVSVVYGMGGGEFWTPFHRDTGSGPYSLVMVDIDGDDFPEAVTANYSSNTVTVVYLDDLESYDTDSYSIQVESSGIQAYDLAAADLDGDGDDDVVTANYGSDNVSVLFNDGGVLSADLLLSTVASGGGQDPFQVEIGDVTDDGELDIVTANTYSDDVTVLAGDGEGNFGPPTTYTLRVGYAGQGPRSLVLEDVSGDGVLDVVTVNSDSDDVVVLVADGAGGLETPVQFSTLDADSNGDYPYDLSIEDMDGDGEPDLVITTLHDQVVVMFGVYGGATFEDPVYYNTYSAFWDAGEEPLRNAVADVDGDGHPDLVAACEESNDLVVFLNDGAGGLDGPDYYEVQDGHGSASLRDLALMDVDGDGYLDGVVTDRTAHRLRVVRGYGDGRFTPSQTHYVSDYLSDVVVGDINGDGLLDWAATDFDDNYVRMGFQRASGDFTNSSVYAYRYTGSYPYTYYGQNPEALAIGDVDEDGWLDLASLAYTDDDVCVFTNQDDGVFSTSYRTYLHTDNAPESVALADVTGDDHLDVLTVSPSYHQVKIHYGDGAGGFGGPSTKTTSSGSSGKTPFHVLAVEITGDTHVDILVANHTTNDVTLLEGLGSGSFKSPLIIPASIGSASAGVYWLGVGDVNGDGLLDVVTANEYTDQVAVMLGFGGAAFAKPQLFDVADTPRSVVVDDFDGDGIDDIGVANMADDSITVLLALGHP